jgi:hypothetical protein
MAMVVIAAPANLDRAAQKKARPVRARGRMLQKLAER